MFRTKFGHEALQDSLECPQVSNSSDRQQLHLLPSLIGLSEKGFAAVAFIGQLFSFCVTIIFQAAGKSQLLEFNISTPPK